MPLLSGLGQRFVIIIKFYKFAKYNHSKMKTFQTILFVALLIFCKGFSQEKITKHTVVAGETITQIAIKYRTTPLNIYKLNPDAQSGIKSNMVLLVPNNSPLQVLKKTELPIIKKAETKQANSTISHEVTTKETLYSLAIQYKTTVEDIEKANPLLAQNGLKIGDTIQIPSKKDLKKSTLEKPKPSAIQNKIAPKPETKTAQNIVYHTVEPKETKYSISKLYEISIEDLEKTNPEIAAGLEIGMQLKVFSSKKDIKKSPLIPAKVESVKPTAPTTKLPLKPEPPLVIKPKPINLDEPYQLYTILPQETVYSISKKFGMTTDALIQFNPTVTDGLKEGSEIKIPVSYKSQPIKSKDFVNLSNSINTQNRKKLLLYLPFNVSKIENDTVSSIANRLKTDKFLNMTLDFYAGAMMAIDSAKTLGINMDIKIIDSEENKQGCNISKNLSAIKDANAVIGPFYQNNAEKVTSLVNESQTIIISPLSKEKHKSSANLVVANPDNETVKNAIFDFMKSKKGNIVAIIDNKKQSTKTFLKQNYPNVKLIPINDKNTFAADSLATYFDQSKPNFVILDSEKTGLILKTTSSLLNLQKDHEVQLVILEKNETLDFEEIPLSRLTKLKMIYSSATKDNESDAAKIFEKEFKLQNKMSPNAFSTRGFDLTFDTILRLAQEKQFAETASDSSSEQVESKFEYQKTNQGGFTNKGVYILEYQTDLTIKVAN